MRNIQNLKSLVSKPSSPLSFRENLAALKSTVTDIAPTEKKSKLWEAYVKTTDTLTILFPLWTVLFAGLALVRPESFAWFTTKYFTASLGILMLSMGITLTLDDFKRVAQQPLAVIVGFVLCYGLCPFLGIALGQAFKLPMDLVAGACDMVELSYLYPFYFIIC